MLGYLKRLVTTGAAYQFGDILAKGLALLTLPLYTRHLSTEAYGVAETLLTAVILVSILLRTGVGEAFIRFYFDDEDMARRERIARTAVVLQAPSFPEVVFALHPGEDHLSVKCRGHFYRVAKHHDKARLRLIIENVANGLRRR